ncbi:helicase-related protein [Fluviispira multicolorata]|uniref:DEAD/DEAH box helicase n=1 Tax=Fluviispira multicolorata TaxID=2654512 RepID=A0A833JBW5_9BACT|nr:helicase-related protein [Fluviispira multicolorata]KAB8029101.1 DEAD/DEAH box helicase [Fluviispira multicolorata]
MTRMTKKKEVSESKVEATVKPKSSGIRSKKVTPKAESSLQKQKKTTSSRAKVEKAVPKKAAPLKAKTVTEKKEKANKVTTPTKAPKKVKIPVRKVAEQPVQTLFSDIERIESEIPKELKKIDTEVIKDSVQKNLVLKTQILIPEMIPAPKYTLPIAAAEQKKKIRFENLVANDSIIEAIKKLGIKEPSETLQNALPAALRGSDLLLIKPEQNDGFLIGVITAASKILSESLPKGTAQTPSILFLCASQKKADEVYSASKDIFAQIGIHFHELKETHSEDEIKSILNKEIDVLISTPKTLNNAKENKLFKSNNVGLCFISATQIFTNENSSDELDKILSSLPQERTQKIFVANENTPIVREIAFKFLEDPEYVSLIPSQIKERSPKQFAHALSATQKFQVLLGHLKNHKPNCAIIFANTKSVAEWIAFKLHGNGIKVDLVTNQLSQQKKIALLNSVKSGDVNIIVATDSISKSIGIQKLNCVYNFDLPDNPKTFLDRLARIEAAKNPIAVSFVCEDYGFNMGLIEDTLGFKIHIAQPDKNYFNIKDTSDYPLETDGKVKRIGVVYDDERTVKEEIQVNKDAPPSRTTNAKERFETLSFTQKVAQIVPPPQVSVPAETPSATAVAPEAQTTQSVVEDQKLQPRQKIEKKDETLLQSTQQKPQYSTPLQKGFEQRKTQQQGSKSPFDNQNRSTDKYVRRDDRAKEAINSAKMAAKMASEKRKDRLSDKSHAMPKRPGILEIAVSLVQDAVQSAASAAKESIATNLQQNLPTLSLMLDRFKILKKPIEKQNELEKKD